MTRHRLTYEPQYSLNFDNLGKPKKVPTGLACVDCTCGLNFYLAPVKEAWHTFAEHGALHAGLRF